LKKKPKRQFNPKTNKTPRKDAQNRPESILSLKPSWRFGMMDLGGPWGWSNIQSKDTLVDIM
jgi:hypothetical protein